MITPFDDYPIHQTASPVAMPADGDPNRYDRYYFNGYDREGGWFFGLALGLYPNRGIIDAAFSVVRDGEQRSVYASGRIPADRARTHVGPIALEIVEPFGVNRVAIDAAHLGIQASLTWTPRTAAVEEPRQVMRAGSSIVMDATRLVQWGIWSGSVDVESSRVVVEAAPGTKDRSWGIRPVGPQVPGAPATEVPGVFFVWAPVHFDDRCVHAVLFEHPDGARWYESAFSVPLLGEGDLAWGAEPKHATITSTIEMAPGTRRAREATLRFAYHDGEREELTFEPLLVFHTKGLGYLHPEWGHGIWHGEQAEGSDSWLLADLDPLDIGSVHTQQVCRVRCGDVTGIGVFEQLAIGPHAPTGLKDLLDGAEATTSGSRPIGTG